MHHIVNRFKSVQVLARSLRAQPQDSIRLLTIKVLRLGMHAAKGILKHVYTVMEVLTKIQRVLRYVAFVAAPFGIALIEPTSVILSAPAIDFSAIVKHEILRLFATIQAVDVLAALA